MLRIYLVRSVPGHTASIKPPAYTTSPLNSIRVSGCRVKARASETAHVVIVRMGGHGLGARHRQERPKGGDPGTAVDNKITLPAPDEVHARPDERVNIRLAQPQYALAKVLTLEPRITYRPAEDARSRASHVPGVIPRDLPDQGQVASGRARRSPRGQRSRKEVRLMTVDVTIVRDTERRRLWSLVQPDLATAEFLHADDYQLITPNGYALTKEDYLGSIASGQLRYQVFEPASEIMVRASSQIALVRYKAKISVQTDNEPARSILCWHTDSYELQGGHWRAVWSQATLISPAAEAEQLDSR